jgi:hypothetical protein
MKERHYLENIAVDGHVMLKWIFQKWNGDMDWSDLTKDIDRCRAFVNSVMNLWVP